jgi:hypothetical protein
MEQFKNQIGNFNFIGITLAFEFLKFLKSIKFFRQLHNIAL